MNSETEHDHERLKDAHESNCGTKLTETSMLGELCVQLEGSTSQMLLGNILPENRRRHKAATNTCRSSTADPEMRMLS